MKTKFYVRKSFDTGVSFIAVYKIEFVNEVPTHSFVWNNDSANWTESETAMDAYYFGNAMIDEIDQADVVRYLPEQAFV